MGYMAGQDQSPYSQAASGMQQSLSGSQYSPWGGMSGAMGGRVGGNMANFNQALSGANQDPTGGGLVVGGNQDPTGGGMIPEQPSSPWQPRTGNQLGSPMTGPSNIQNMYRQGMMANLMRRNPMARQNQMSRFTQGSFGPTAPSSMASNQQALSYQNMMGSMANAPQWLRQYQQQNPQQATQGLSLGGNPAAPMTEDAAEPTIPGGNPNRYRAPV